MKACPAHWRKELDQPGHRMDRHALRAIVNGAVHGDSALVSADQLMTASRRDHPLMSVSAEPPGSQDICPATDSYRRPPQGTRPDGPRSGPATVPVGWRFPAATRRTGEPGSAESLCPTFGLQQAVSAHRCGSSGAANKMITAVAALRRILRFQGTELPCPEQARRRAVGRPGHVSGMIKHSELVRRSDVVPAIRLHSG